MTNPNTSPATLRLVNPYVWVGEKGVSVSYVGGQFWLSKSACPAGLKTGQYSEAILGVSFRPYNVDGRIVDAIRFRSLEVH